MQDSAYIYQLRNLVNGHVYIGSAWDGNNRPNQHFKHLKNKKHKNSYLQRAWNKYGAENFVAEILETCSGNERFTREQWWIDNKRAAESGFGYNICYPVRGLMPSKRMSKRSKESWQKATETERENRLSGVKLSWQDPEHRKKMSKVMSDSRKNPEFDAKMKASLRSNGYRKKRAEIAIAVWQRDGHKEKCSSAIKAAFTDERKDAYAARIGSYWADPKYRKKMSEQSADVWTPELREEHKQRMTAHFKDPEYKEKHRARMKAWWAERKAKKEPVMI